MIIYEDSVSNFIQQCLISRNISEVVTESMHLHNMNAFDQSQINAWKASLPEVAKVLSTSDIDRECDVGIEYKPSVSRDRVDFLICGEDEHGARNVVVLELKQWSDVSDSNKPYFVFTNGGGGLKDYWHPSYQAENYISIIRNFNEYIQKEKIGLHACSYLHNMPERIKGTLNDEAKFPLVRISPAFLSEDQDELKEFIEKYVKKPYRSKRGSSLLYEIDNSRLVPSNQLADTLDSSLKGNGFFSYDEHQAIAVSTIVSEVREAKFYNEKKTILIKGGPGSGKSVVALNAMGELIKGTKKNSKDKITTVYVTANAAPKNMYKAQLIGKDYSKCFLSELFKSPSSFQKCKENDFDCVLVDEAHRVFHYAAGSYGISKKLPDGIESLIRASYVTVFFVDDNQFVTRYDYGTIDHIKAAARKYHSRVIEGKDLELTSEFRCLGGEDYVSFIRGFLGYGNGNKSYFVKNNRYDFRIFDCAKDMMDEIKKRDIEERKGEQRSGRCRIVSGYTFDWVTKGKRREEEGYDIALDLDNEKPFYAKWNLFNSSLPADYSWLNDPDSIEEVGCIHSAQGLDMPYCGVIIGMDMTYDDKTHSLVFNNEVHPSMDKSISNKREDKDISADLIRNTYHVLLTRGIKGTYVYCQDRKLREYLKGMIQADQ